MKESSSFDVTMVAYDGAEVWELIDIYMLHLIGKKYDSKNIGLYRDGGLAVFKNVSGPASEKIKEHLQYLFQQKSLQIIIECNLKVESRNTLYSHPVRSPTIYGHGPSKSAYHNYHHYETAPYYGQRLAS